MTKTTRVMLAVLAACGASAAMAQSSVNLYGRVNTVIENTKEGTFKNTVMNSSSSYIGFRGVEDLGNGLKAGFVLESSFASDTGAGPMDFTRQSEVYLGGNFGTLRLGNFDPASYLATADAVSMHNHDTGSSADALNYYSGSFNGISNKIAYVTPDFGGLTAEIQYSLGEKAIEDTGLENRGGWDLGVNYGNGPLGLGFGYSKESQRDVDSGFKVSAQQYALRANYSIGDLTLGGYYQRQELKAADVFKLKRNVYRLAAMYTIGASELHANIGRADKLKVQGVSVPNSAATQWTLAYNYNLSKRTKIYTFYTNINNANATAAGFVDAFMGEGALDEKVKFRSFGVGVRHLF